MLPAVAVDSAAMKARALFLAVGFGFLLFWFRQESGQLVLAGRSRGRRAVVPALSAWALGTFPVAGDPLMALASTTAAWLSVGQFPRSLAAKKS